MNLFQNSKRKLFLMLLQLNWLFTTGRDVVWYYVHEEIPCKSLKIPLFDLNIEIIGLEFHQIKRKWLFVETYKQSVVNGQEFTNELFKIFNHFSSKYENVLIIGDLNMSIENAHFSTLLQLFSLNMFINLPTCYHSHTPNCIDHILTNQTYLFKFSKRLKLACLPTIN